MKKIILLVSIILSFNLYSFENVNSEKENISNIQKEIEKYNSKEIIKDIDQILLSIDKEKYLNEYKKYLLKEKTLLLSKMIFMNDDKEAIKKQIIPAFFKLNMCMSYHFRANIQTRVDDILNKLLTTENRKNMFSKASQYVYSKKVQDVFIEYIKGVGDDINKICQSPLNLNTLKIKEEIEFFEKNKKENTK